MCCEALLRINTRIAALGQKQAVTLYVRDFPRLVREGEGVHRQDHQHSGRGSQLDACHVVRYDTDGSISHFLEMERENPEAMLDSDQLEQVAVATPAAVTMTYSS